MLPVGFAVRSTAGGGDCWLAEVVVVGLVVGGRARAKGLVLPVWEGMRRAGWGWKGFVAPV